jgi:hypothetical protein
MALLLSLFPGCGKDRPLGKQWRPGENAEAVVAGLKANLVTEIEVVLLDVDRKGRVSVRKRVNVTDAKERILDSLRDSEFYSGGCGCGDIGYLLFTTVDGCEVRIGFSDHRFSLSYRAAGGNEKTEFRNSGLALFVNAFLFDTDNRVFDKTSFEQALLPAAKRGDGQALSLLTRHGFGSAAQACPGALRPDGAGLSDEDLHMLLLDLSRLDYVDDPQAVGAVAQLLDSDNINIARGACEVLRSWGHLDYLKNRAKNRETANTYLAFWFAENRMIDSAVCAVRAMGVDRYDLSHYYVFLRLEEDGEKLPPGDKRQIYLLMADMIEAQPHSVFLNLLTDLWDSMGMEHDFNRGRLVILGTATDCPDILQEMHTQAPQIAKEVRAWTEQWFP